MVKKIIILFACALCTLAASGPTSSFVVDGYGRTLHVVYLMDKDPKLKRVIQEVNSRLQEEIVRMQNALNARIRKYYISDNNFSSPDCYDILTGMDVVAGQDIVIICGVAHGEGIESADEYPEIKFAEDDRRNFGEIMDLVLVKKPAYLLSILNSCNHFPGQGGTEAETLVNIDIEGCEMKPGSFNHSHYRQLFQPATFPVAVTYLSSQKGTVTYINKTGGIPFNAFIESLQHWTSNASEAPSWAKVLYTAQAISVCRSERSGVRTECPYAEIAKVTYSSNQIILDGESVVFCD